MSLKDGGSADPYPSKTWLALIDSSNSPYMRIRAAERHINRRWRNEPGEYHNGGIWPFVGGFHIVASALSGRRAEASRMLELLAKANRLGSGGLNWRFHEWLHGDSGAPDGAAMQLWNAGTYVLAYHALTDISAVQKILALR